jgi:lysine biosynthesis protein LysW
MITGFCPECDGELKFDTTPSEGNLITCPQCSAYLEVVSVSPLEFDWAYDDEDYDDIDDEDFDDDFDDDEDF